MDKGKVFARHFTTREKYILGVTVVLILIFGGYQFVFRPLKEYAEELENKIALAEKRLKKNFTIIQKATLVDEEYEKYAPDFRQKVSDEQEMALILSEIESVANKINMRVADMKPKKVKRVDFYNNFSVSLTIDGEVESIMHFLYTLQLTPHFFQVEEVQLEKSSVRTTQIKCRLVLSRALIL